ncbi:SAM-dependent methyltransferase [Fusibacter paucivorans]|uniref:SAM-dependent methyltransferase n=1 Tax=Fusibacter paucivorans TaxID=76009 RepID=A0ABS5PRW6_9FIRM|nr:TrmO family methyltransferase [Fusibacter paucivorans]MBS7527823.1 SAM-dependent methyltransferase [Fusibacter paucivorans]
MQLKTIGIIHPVMCLKASDSCHTFDIVLDAAFMPAIVGLTPKLSVMITYWDMTSKRDVLMLKPPGSVVDLGVFASRSQNRPNPILQAIAEIVDIAENTLTVTCPEKMDQCPVLDIKPYIPVLDAIKFHH